MEILAKKSPCIFFVVLVLHLLACLAVIKANLILVVQVLLWLFILFSVVLYFLKYQKQLKCYYKNNQWFLENAKGEMYQTTLLGSTFISLPIIILNFPGQSILLAADVMDKDLLRRLRVVLLG